MSRGAGGIGVAGSVVVVLVLASFVVFGALLGPERAARIAAAAALNAAVDPLAENAGPHRVPVLDLHVDPDHLATLGADLPWSGGRYVPAELRHNGVHYRARFRYRGALTPSNFLGGKKSFRLAFKKPLPHIPFRRVNVVNPKSFNLLNNHMGLWIGGYMGVPVPHDEPVFVRLNGGDLGVMELCEQPDGDFERVRGLHHVDVPVYKGDFGPLRGRALGAINQLWADARHWQFAGKAADTSADARLRDLVAAINDTTLALDARRTAIEGLVDVDAFLRFIAAMQVVNTSHIDQTHNQVLVLSPRTGRFYPVLWDPLLMYAQPEEPLYHIHDALAYWILRVPEWRLAKDRHVHEALAGLHHKGLFQLHWRSTEHRLLPSLLADRNKYANVTPEPEDVHRYSVLHAFSSSASMRASIAAYWDRLSARLAANDVQVVRSPGEVRITAASEAPLRVTWRAEGDGAELVLRDEGPVPVERGPGGLSVVLHRDVAHSGPVDGPFAEKSHYRVLPLETTLRFPAGTPSTLVITNAITDEEVR